VSMDQSLGSSTTQMQSQRLMSACLCSIVGTKGAMHVFVCKLMGISFVCRVQVFSVDNLTVVRTMSHPVPGEIVCGIAANTAHWFVTTRNNVHKFVMATGEHVFSVGTTGTAIGQCHGIALYGTELFVADVERKRVMVFESDGGAFVREFGDGQLGYPLEVAVNAAHVFVTDYPKRVVLFDHVDGRCVRTVDVGVYGYALVCTHTFFAVSGYDYVRVFDTTSGTVLHTFGSEGSGPLQFDGVVGMTIVGDRLWIVDKDNHRIQIVA
jgi:DNA-binding beta-propeller fold protein YncE